MKKNISINFFGTIYAIDEDAYKLLEDYIANMKLYFSHEEGGEEIADDIEHRVAELLWEYKEQGMSAVDIDTVKEIIEKIGNPADIDDEGSSKHTTTATDNASDTPDEEEENRKREQKDEKKSEQNGLNTLVDKINDLFAKLRQNMEGRHLYRDTKNKMLEDITTLLGGRVAEEIIFGDITTGASNDIKRATETARSMVMKYGMSEKIGLIAYGNDDDEVFIGRDLAHTRGYSEEVAREIDAEISRIISECHEKAESIIREHTSVLHSCASLLLEKEKVHREEFEALFTTENEEVAETNE